jgi:pimeloyl-ACP methyl ester carboxylesterase
MGNVGDIGQWWSQGERLRLRLCGVEREIFLRRQGSGPVLTLLHGFPSSSHDWAKLVPALAREHTLLAPDFLGFGASAKPADHIYSLHEQADLVEALWRAQSVTSTRLIAHDYAVSVAQELLARRREGKLAVELEGALLLNGGLYPDLHRPEPTQIALLDPEQGPQLSALLTEQLLATALAPTFAPGYDAAQDSADIWRSISRDDGQRIAHLLIRYIADRERHGERWTSALEQTDVALAFAWGMLDPISGAHMAQRIRARLPQAPFAALDHVGHWPALEAPDAVLAAHTLLAERSPRP